jgi:hypothetical protein
MVHTELCLFSGCLRTLFILCGLPSFPFVTFALGFRRVGCLLSSLVCIIDN